MENENIAEFVPLVDHEDYEILSVYPFTIRRKDNHLEVAEHISQEGYPRVHLNAATYVKHRLIAQQFIHNDDPVHKTQVDHINRDRADYHLENLRWCTQNQNQMNKLSNRQITYTYLTSIPDDALKVTDYNEHTFEDYYYYENKFYFYNGLDYRLLHVNEPRKGGKYVNMMNTNGQRTRIYFSKFKKMYDLD